MSSHDDCRVVGCSACAERGRVERDPGMPRPPAVDTSQPLSPSVGGTETGTGGLNRHRGTQATDAATLIAAAASLHTIADHMPNRSPEFVRGVRYAATLLGHTADDLTELKGTS
jgi:hypothetical protein